MKNIFVVDTDIKKSIAIIDFVPEREERVILEDREYKVKCVVYHPKQNSILVFVNLVDSYYSKLLKDITW